MGVRGDYALFQYFLKLMVKKKRNCESRDLFNHLFSQPLSPQATDEGPRPYVKI